MALVLFPWEMLIDPNGAPRIGARAYFYLPTTTTPIVTYTTDDYSVPHDFPVESESDGFFPAIYINPAVNPTFKVVVQDVNGVEIKNEDNVSAAVTYAILTTQFLGGILYPQTLAEAAALVTPTNKQYQAGDLRRYGCTVDGSGDNSTKIQSAISAAVATGGVGYIYHPGGTIAHASQISVPNGLSVIGVSRAESVFNFTGTPSGSPANTRSSWRYNSGAVNSSGYANVSFRHCKFTNSGAVDFGAAIELSAGGWSYFEVYDCWIAGTQSYGILLDGVEIAFVHGNLVENVNATACVNIWVTNGPDRSAGQTRGFTNVVTIRENQISSGAGSFGILDDGGNAHVIQGNNFNENRFPMQMAGVTGGLVAGNSFETTRTTGSANVVVTNVSGSGAHVGPCSGVTMHSNGFYGNVSASGNLLDFTTVTNTITAITNAAAAVVTVNTVSTINPFQVDEMLSFSGVVGMTQINALSGRVTALGGVSGAWTATVGINSSGFSAYVSGGLISNYHTGFHIHGNNFGSQVNRVGGINVQYLANSWCGPNNDFGNSSMAHYRNVHNDTYGNTLLPTENGDQVALNVSGPTHCDTRFPEIFYGGVSIGNATVKATDLLVGSKTFDWPSVAAGATSNTTVTVTGATLAGKYLIECTMSIDIGVTANLFGHVESADTVRVILHNLGVGALDLASATLNVTLLKVT